MLLEDIRVYLEQQGLGVFGKDLFISIMPAEPDNCIVLFEYAGEPMDLTDSRLEYPNLQVLVRNTDYLAGRQKIEEVTQALHGVSEQVINGTRYLLIQARQSPFFLEWDKNERAIFVCNFRIIKEVG